MTLYHSISREKQTSQLSIFGSDTQYFEHNLNISLQAPLFSIFQPNSHYRHPFSQYFNPIGTPFLNSSTQFSLQAPFFLNISTQFSLQAPFFLNISTQFSLQAPFFSSTLFLNISHTLSSCMFKEAHGNFQFW